MVAVRLRGAGHFAAHPRFIGKIRGALGDELKQTASEEARAGKPCPWQPPCAFDILFRSQGAITPGLEIPKPYVLALDGDGGDAVLRLALFGFATDWIEAASEALVRALRHGVRHMSLREAQIIERRVWAEDVVRMPDVEPAAVVIGLLTPLEIRRQARNRETVEQEADPDDFDFLAFVTSLSNRVSGLARWQDILVDADFQALKEKARRLSIRQLPHPPRSWKRYSNRQARWVPMQGRQRALLIEGDLGEVWPLLVIGETTHVGSHTSLGLGRYALFVPR